MDVSPETIWVALGVVISALATIGAAFARLGHLAGRVGTLEQQMRERADERQQERADRDRWQANLETSLSALRAQIQLFGDGLGASREAALERFAPMAQLQSLDRKMDGLSSRLGGVETAQAETKATLRAVLDSIAKFERALDRRGTSIP